MLRQQRSMPLWMLYMVFLTISTAAAYMIVASWDRGPVGDELIADFPILIIMPAGDSEYRVDIVGLQKLRYDDMPDDYTFLVPVGEEIKVNRKLAEQVTLPGGIREIEVEYLADGQQRIKVTRSGEVRRFIGWYVASDGQIVPEYFVYHFPVGWLLLAIPTGFAVSTVALGIIYCIQRCRQKHR